MKANVIAFVLMIAMALGFAYLVLKGPSAPNIVIKNVEPGIDQAGYYVDLVVETDKPVKIIGYIIGLKYYPTSIYLHKGINKVRLHLAKNPGTSLRLDIAGAGFRDVKLPRVKYEREVWAAWGRKHVFIYGTVPDKMNAIVSYVPIEPKVAVVTTMDNIRAYWYLRKSALTRVPFFDVERLNLSEIAGYNILVFYGVGVGPSLLDAISRLPGEHVVVVDFDGNYGSLVADLVNVTIVLRKGSPTLYFGAVCVVREESDIDIRRNPVFQYFDVFLHNPRTQEYAIANTERCTKNIDAAMVYNVDGDILMARVGKKLVVSTMNLAYTLIYVRLGGVFSHKFVFVPIKPFQGFLPVKATKDPVAVVYVFRSDYDKYVVLNRTLADLSVSGLSAKITFTGFRGYHNVTIDSYTYGLRPVNTTTTRVLMPGSIAMRLERNTAYVVKVDGEPVVVIAEENLAPDVDFGYAVVSVGDFYELTSLSVRLKIRYPTTAPVTIYVDGVPVKEVYGPFDGKLGFKIPAPGRLEVDVVTPYGQYMVHYVKNVEHIYKSPIFLGALFLAGVTFLGLYTSLRARPTFEVSTVRVVFYRKEELVTGAVDIGRVVSAVNTLEAQLRRAPTLGEVLRRMLKKASISNVGSLLEAISKAVRSGRIRMSWIYSPELGRYITVLATRHNPYAEANAYLFRALAPRFGIVADTPRGYESITKADVRLDDGRKMLFVYVAGRGKGGLRNAINTALTEMEFLRKAKIKRTYAGAVIVTRPELVQATNKVINEILSGNQEVAEKILRDMSVFGKITSWSTSMDWKKKLIVAAVPYTHISVLLAGFARGDYELVNKYYRVLAHYF